MQKCMKMYFADLENYHVGNYVVVFCTSGI